MTEVAAIDLAALAGPSHGALLRRRALAHKGLMIGATLLVLISARRCGTIRAVGRIC